MTDTYPAPAKINLYLRITDLLANGMHALDTVFVYTDLCDQIQVDESEQIVVTCSEARLSGEKNLVHHLLTALQREYSIRRGLRLHIDKRIPDQAGLGGGSSDAATALMIANQRWQLQMSRDAMIAFAAPFGADIPCFLFQQASRATGIGEQLQPYNQPLPSGALLLAKPASGLSTAAVFAHFDRALTTRPALDTIRRDPPQLAENDLQASACALNPDVAKLLAAMQSEAVTAWMSGSGSACVALLDDADAACALAAELKQQQLAEWTHVGMISSIHPLHLGT